MNYLEQFLVVKKGFSLAVKTLRLANLDNLEDLAEQAAELLKEEMAINGNTDSEISLMIDLAKQSLIDTIRDTE